MSKHLKKIISVFLVVLMLTGSAPLDGFKSLDFGFIPELNFSLPEIDFSLFSLKSRALEENGFTYTAIDDTYCTITGYTGTDTEVIVPSELGGYIVQQIGDSAFKTNKTITKVVLPDTITTIENYAFSGCTSLIDIEIQEGITRIGTSAFYDCSNLENLVLPDSITTLGSNAFWGTKKLLSINLPKNINKCESWMSMGPFSGSSLISVTIPQDVKKIPDYTFCQCINLKEIILPDNITSIGSSAFYNCDSLKEMFLPDTVTEIKMNAFNNCEMLENIICPKNLQTIGIYAFENCKALKSIEFNENLTSIGDSAFSSCSSLENVILPDSITKLGYQLFTGCPKITSINYPLNLGSITESSSAWGPFTSSYIETIYVPEGVTALPDHIFGYCNKLKNVILPDGLTSIGKRAFINCTSLEELTLPDSVKTLGYSVFQGCSSLKTINYPMMLESGELPASAENITIPYGVTKISDRAFYGCKIKSINIPESVTSIGAYAFSLCASLENVVFNENLAAIGNNAFSSCTSLKSVELNDKLVSIGSNAFKDCSSLNNIKLKDGLESIGAFAFQNCTSLENIKLPDSITTLGSQLFYGCEKLTSVNYPLNLAKCELATTQTQMAADHYRCPFAYSYISEIIIPDGVEKIVSNAFAGMDSDVSIIMPDTIKEIGNFAFYNSDGISSIDLPDSIIIIGEYAFNDCDNLVFVKLPKNLETIKREAFFSCDALTEVILPDGLVSIENNAFSRCLNLKELIIPQSVISIARDAFYNCTNTTFYCYYNSYAHQYLQTTSFKYELLFDHAHDVVEVTTIAPTCTLPGKKTLTCSICGYVTTDDAPALGHSFGDWTEIKNPTVLTEGKMSRTCSVCAEVETKITDRVTIDIENTNEYGIANFTVVNTQTLAPVKNANIFISTEKDGESTFYTDEEGKVSIVLPVGENVITAHAKGLISRTLTIDIVHGMNEIPAIGLGSSPIVEAELITTPMTKEEIEDAGIDTTAPGNNNVIKYEVTFEFTAKDDEPKKETVTETFYVNSNGEHFYQNNNQSSTHEIFGKPVTIYPTERFYLIITGDIIWLKEMFHVQLYAYNNSNTDWIEDVVATLNLPEGLSLADMIEGEQTLSQQIGKIAEGGQADCEWYIRGDKEGIYDLTATLDGRIMPFNEEFSNEYTAESAIKVYSGKGMSLSFEVPSTTYCGDEYPVKIILKNISDKPIYNVAHILTGIQQSKVTHYSNGEVVEELYVKDALNASKFVEEFKAGDEIVIEVTAEILFKSEQYKDCFFELVDIILGAKELGEAINNNFGFPTEHDWSEWETVKEATCGETGQEKRICKNNSEHIEYRDVEKLPHNWDNGVIDPASTCNTHGTKTFTCQNDASHTKTESVPLDANNHFGDTYIKDEKDATCIEDGYTGDTYCADCDKKLESGEVIHATGHDWSEWKTVKEPTYTEMGEEKRVCSKCDAEETKSIPVLTRPSDENDNIETEKTVEYDSATGEAVIKLVASSKGEKITVNSRTPLDIVLVLDQSGSMEGDLLKKLKTATEDFTNAIYQDALENGIDHRIAMVGFAMQNQYNFSSEYPQYLNTEVLTTGGAPIQYNSLSTAKMNEVYRNALVSVNVDGTLNPVLTLAKNNLQAKGATAADLGLDMACQIFAQNENDGSRKRIVVFMTDGVPTYKSDYMEETATNATTKANLLKDAYDADLYSVGVLSGSNTNKAKTFLNNIASKDENNKALYFDCADADKLVEDFQTIATQSTTVTTDFADITLIDTVSAAFTLTAVQENELRKNAIEKLGITNDDITITRYADGTTEVKLAHINPVAVTDGDDVNYVIDIDFRVTANEKALIAGSYGTNTDNAGVLIGTTDVYENNFAVPGATVENAEGVIYFTVNGIVYHIVRVHKGDNPEAPEFTLDGEYTFSGWDIPDEVVFDGGKLTVDATLSQKEYTVTWNTADGATTDTYHVGDIIVAPEVGLNARGEEFIEWNTEVPVTMSAENLEFTAIYGKHEHSYTEKVIKKVSCGVEGKVQYICSCGDSYTETAPALTHKWTTSATSTDGSETAYSYVYCENCGESPEKTLTYTITGTSGKKQVTYDLKLVDAENITVQPDGNIKISLPVPQNMKNARNITIYREEADGTLTNLNGTVKNGYITFTTTHFSIYIIEAEYECAETGNHTDEDTDNICDICENEIPVEEPSENCNHYCHQKGFMNFLWKIFNFLYKLFGMEAKRICECGVAHW